MTKEELIKEYNSGIFMLAKESLLRQEIIPMFLQLRGYNEIKEALRDVGTYMGISNVEDIICYMFKDL